MAWMGSLWAAVCGVFSSERGDSFNCADAMDLMLQSTWDCLSAEQHDAVQGLVDRLGLSIESLQVVRMAIEISQGWAIEEGQWHDFEESDPDVPAEEVCFALWELARATGVGDPKDQLKAWGFSDGKDVGDVVYGLVAVGLILECEYDQRSDFDGIAFDQFAQVAPRRLKPKGVSR